MEIEISFEPTTFNLIENENDPNQTSRQKFHLFFAKKCINL